ncbi:putative peroxisomal adenine nucleotide transporter 1 [Phaeomoniella chlamydospora]|uniref:Putative peroxisomal adenine nucleotide transporter 1 n=1 Tax=Phaeomoniella chlamydospora TaxID=158046 RepID=A0A0G2ES02_PHACM|nr:putative peroxisomal adenine nucleotide transporter 1 [Phaeomoniella chlamydospora]
MANIYNSQLDAFDLYHKIREIASEEQERINSSIELPAVGHAVAGSVAAALSNVVTYPLDLLITRLQTQKRLQKGGSSSESDEYKNLQYALANIYEREGLAGFYTGLLEDTGKTMLDSFLFFLAYTYLRQKRLARFARNHGGKVPSLLPTVDELGIGFVAGSLTKLVTTPISNIVTRKQIGAVASSSPSPAGTEDPLRGPNTTLSTRDIIRSIHDSKGILGFWSGYSASLILTLNPSLTFFYFEALKRLFLPRSKRGNPPAMATFLLAAVSKALASSLTYPFSLAKARMQTSGTTNKSEIPTSSQRTTILTTLLYLLRTQGPSSLYSGLSLELTKGFFSHGITMLIKQNIHTTILSLYLSLSHLYYSVRSSFSPSSRPRRHRHRPNKNKNNKEYYDMALERVEGVVQTTTNATEDAINTAVDKSKQAVSAATNTMGYSANKTLEVTKSLGPSVIHQSEDLINDLMDMVEDSIPLELLGKDYGVGDD